VPDIPDDTPARLAEALGDKFEVRTLVGRGGFADVFEVWDQALERRLAVKVLRPDVGWTAGMLERFKQETRAIAKLEHPHILPIHFVGEGGGGTIVYYAMPFVEGRSLGDLLRQSGPLPADRALAIAEPILDALQHAHDAGLLHRDIKPDNIMLDVTRGRPLLVDFGIARRLDADGGLTQAGLVVGTPHYMSPEQALGERTLDGRSDLYAMGAVLYQMVTGTPPFDGETSQEIVGKHIAEPLRPPRETHPDVPGWLSDVIARCLEKKPAARYPSAAHVLDALAAGRGPGAAPVRSYSAARSAAGISASAATDVVASGARPGATRSAPTVPVAATSRRRRVRRAAAIALPLALLATAALWFVTPRLAFRNELAVPVAVRVDAEERTVAPGAGFAMRLERGRGATVTWSLVRPTTSDGAPLGERVADTVALGTPRGRARVNAAARPGERAYFAPLITNRTGGALRVIVNAGLQGATECACRIPDGAERMALGYYRLFANSTVQVIDEGGRTATFENLGPEVDAESGVVGLEFREGDLR
jgi:hypothetical protein